MVKYFKLFLLTLLTAVIALVVVPSESVAKGSYFVVQLTDNDVDDVAPQINNSGTVIWMRHDQDYSREGKKYMLFRGASISLLPFTFDKTNLRLNNNDKIAFNDNFGIYLYDIDKSSATKVSDFGSVLELNDDNYVLIYQGDPFQGDIYLYDGLITTQITNDASYKWHCKLNNIGQEIIWYGGNIPPINSLEIMKYDGMKTIPLTQNGYLDQFPNIANGIAVWQGFLPNGGENGEIFFYDGVAINQLTANNYTDQGPQINNSGWIVWEGGDSDFEIFLFNGTFINQLTDNDYNDSNPKISNNGHIVWYSSHSNIGDVFVYDGLTTTQLTHGGYKIGGNQVINDRGEIVWCAREVSIVQEDDENTFYGDYEIFLAKVFLGDVEDDGDVDGFDLTQFVGYYALGYPPADLNEDIAIDELDLAEFARYFGQQK